MGVHETEEGSDDHFTRVQRPATIDTRRKQLRLLASAIARAGVAVDALVDLRAMLVPEVAARGLQHLLDRNNGESRVQISNLADFLPTLAARLDMPDDLIAKLSKLKKKLKVSQHGMTARNREALRAFDDKAAVEALLQLPQRSLRRGMGERQERLSGSEAGPNRAGDRVAAQRAGTNPEPRLDPSRPASAGCRRPRQSSRSPAFSGRRGEERQRSRVPADDRIGRAVEKSI